MQQGAIPCKTKSLSLFYALCLKDLERQLQIFTKFKIGWKEQLKISLQGSE